MPETVPLPPPTGAFPGGEVVAASRESPTPTADGLRIRCPQCHNPIQLGDGKRFIFNLVPREAPTPITLVENWPAELKKKD